MKKLAAIALLFSFNTSAACNFDVVFNSAPKTKQQKVELSPEVNLYIAQRIAKQTIGGAVVATNVTCQYLDGKKYTNSEAEWKRYLDNAIKALGKSGVSSLDVTIVGSEGKLYEGELTSFEYQFDADFSGNKQVIKNVAMLDQNSNSLITLSVSGNEAVEESITNELKRLIGSFELTK